MNRLLCLLFTLLSLPSLPSLAAVPPDVALIVMGQTHSYWKALVRGVEAEAEKKGLTLISMAPEFENQVDSQRGLVRRAVDLGVRGIIIAPSDQRGLVDELRAASAKGVKIIVVDSATSDSFDGFVASDNRAAGVAIGSYIRARLAPDAHVMMLCGPLSVGSLNSRFQGAYGKLAEGGGVDVITDNLLLASEAPRYLDPAKERLLGADAVFACNQSATEAMLSFFDRNPVAKPPKLFGFDVTNDFLLRVERGELAAVVIQDPYAMGNMALTQMSAILSGKTAATEDVPTYIVDGAALDDPQIRRIAGRQL